MAPKALHSTGHSQKNDTQDAALARENVFCGVQFDDLDAAATLEKCAGVTTADKFRFIVTPNVDHVVRLNQEPDIFEPLYKAAWLSVCDSRILQLLAKFSGRKLHAVPGSDLTASLFSSVIKPNEPVNVIGGNEDIISAVSKRYGLMKVNHHQPPMGLRNKPNSVAAAAKFIAKNPARFTFICVGSPQQEMVAKAALESGHAKGLGLCVGASLDFLAGKVKRAPAWMQKARLEWLYRLASEPKRMWKRYLVEGPKIFFIWAKWIMTQKKY
jgi:N-acetylglucosaminyldiphosphoundecaprenol N-acetyl-beta-D-mannosaminyltransferase